jgi:hypothetical protein
MGMPHIEPILKDNFIIRRKERLLFKFSISMHLASFFALNGSVRFSDLWVSMDVQFTAWAFHFLKRRTIVHHHQQQYNVNYRLGLVICSETLVSSTTSTTSN